MNRKQNLDEEVSSKDAGSEKKKELSLRVWY